jgi:hypothetical protein
MIVMGHFRVTSCPLDGRLSQREIPEDSSAEGVGGVGALNAQVMSGLLDG